MTKYYFVKYNGRWTVARKVTLVDGVFAYSICDVNNTCRYEEEFDEIGDEILLPEED
jgi:hypothetical protein